MQPIVRSIWVCGRGALVLLSCQSTALVSSGIVPDSRQFCMLNMSRLSEVVQSCACQPGPYRSGEGLASQDAECEAASTAAAAAAVSATCGMQHAKDAMCHTQTMTRRLLTPQQDVSYCSMPRMACLEQPGCCCTDSWHAQLRT